jgi:hypothetical protein
MRKFITQIDSLTARGGEILGRGAAVAGSTYMALDKGLPAAGMALRGNPVVAHPVVKVGVAVVAAGAVEAVLWFGGNDADALKARRDATEARLQARIDAANAKRPAVEQPHPAADKQAANG